MPSTSRYQARLRVRSVTVMPRWWIVASDGGVGVGVVGVGPVSAASAVSIVAPVGLSTGTEDAAGAPAGTAVRPRTPPTYSPRPHGPSLAHVVGRRWRAASGWPGPSWRGAAPRASPRCGRTGRAARRWPGWTGPARPATGRLPRGA